MSKDSAAESNKSNKPNAPCYLNITTAPHLQNKLYHKKQYLIHHALFIGNLLLANSFRVPYYILQSQTTYEKLRYNAQLYLDQ